MNIETAIEMLRKRAEYRASTATSPEGKRSADKIVDAVNVIIEYYNTQDDNNSQAANMRDKLVLLSEYLNVDKEDISNFIDMDTRFMRKRMEARIDMTLPESDWWTEIIADWRILQKLQDTHKRICSELEGYRKMANEAGEHKEVYAPVIKAMEEEQDALILQIDKILN